MERPSLLDRLGSAVLAEHSAEIDRRAQRWLWSGWAVSALLGFLMPLYKGTTHLHGGVALGAAVLVMIDVAAATRRPMICLTMSAFGIVAGSAFGFGLLAALTHRPLTLAITAQMAVGTVLLGRLFLRELRPKPALPEDTFWEEVKLLPKEEAQALVLARLESLHAEVDEMNARLSRTGRGMNLMLIGGVVALAGGAVVIVGNHTALSEKAIWVALPLAAIGLVIVLVGARIVKAA